jgi:hypothetical protein
MGRKTCGGGKGVQLTLRYLRYLRFYDTYFPLGFVEVPVPKYNLYVDEYHIVKLLKQPRLPSLRSLPPVDDQRSTLIRKDPQTSLVSHLTQCNCSASSSAAFRKLSGPRVKFWVTPGGQRHEQRPESCPRGGNSNFAMTGLHLTRPEREPSGEHDFKRAS